MPMLSNKSIKRIAKVVKTVEQSPMSLTPYQWDKRGILKTGRHPFKGSITKGDTATAAEVELTIITGYVNSNLWNEDLEDTTIGIKWATTGEKQAFVDLPNTFSAYLHLECNDLEEFVKLEIVIEDDEDDPPESDFNHGYHKILSGEITSETVGEGEAAVTTYSAVIEEQLLTDNLYQDKANLVWYWWPTFIASVNITIEVPPEE